jgi:hypothetical protein
VSSENAAPDPPALPVSPVSELHPTGVSHSVVRLARAGGQPAGEPPPPDTRKRSEIALKFDRMLHMSRLVAFFDEYSDSYNSNTNTPPIYRTAIGRRSNARSRDFRSRDQANNG